MSLAAYQGPLGIAAFDSQNFESQRGSECRSRQPKRELYSSKEVVALINSAFPFPFLSLSLPFPFPSSSIPYFLFLSPSPFPFLSLHFPFPCSCVRRIGQRERQRGTKVASSIEKALMRTIRRRFTTVNRSYPPSPSTVHFKS